MKIQIKKCFTLHNIPITDSEIKLFLKRYNTLGENPISFSEFT